MALNQTVLQDIKKSLKDVYKDVKIYWILPASLWNSTTVITIMDIPDKTLKITNENRLLYKPLKPWTWFFSITRALVCKFYYNQVFLTVMYHSHLLIILSFLVICFQAMIVMKNGRHQLYMETPPIREKAINETLSFLLAKT